ncbi:TrbG/VirB9 family P-type conjugative transfer protein [Vibrio tapetis]|uniref:Conjugal transfer protein n=1 Tax=Vibrio tapetis subsp. tapetis TaxID=1671868 RepID=A0A2N8ZI18_9VIBR|nr:TrbG/VirB9 family P-type conjugative transfer protein [Vibrio tapetis]SON51506.1 conserved exported protein of unknown function [Vibrio tapetis subsp. tapetis]
MKTQFWSPLLVVMGCLSVNAYASVCQPLDHKPGEIISVKTAKYMGGRIQLPSNLISAPSVSNPHLWDVEGVVGSNQIMVKPNSSSKEGISTMIYAFTDDGSVYDIMATRTTTKQNQPCVLVNAGRGTMNKEQQQAISTFVLSKNKTAPVMMNSGRVQDLEKQLATIKSQSLDKQKRAVIDALRKYRYRIYTRYEWTSQDSFVGNNIISDVYDDGQFTYVRLSNPSRGILSIETEIGGKAAIAPTKYDDAYGMYKVTGIYANLRLRIDDVVIEVTRTDNTTHSNT